jgi:predicted GIY-YIG superfamily endonuclease
MNEVNGKWKNAIRSLGEGLAKLRMARPYFETLCKEVGWKIFNNERKMFYVYIIRSIKYPNQFYTGFTENFEERLKCHNYGKSTHTSKFTPWKLEVYFAFQTKKTALDFEKYLKTASGIAFRNKRLLNISNQ